MKDIHQFRSTLLSLEDYQKQRNQLRTEVIAHKKNRAVYLGANVHLLFEDETTVRYQIQEMLRIEKVFTQEGIQDELEAYFPLIPDGTNLKATMMIEYPDPAERAVKLRQLKGVEGGVWLAVAGFPRIHPIADEDLERENDEKTSAVHFLRFQFGAEMIQALQSGAGFSAGIDFSNYPVAAMAIEGEVRKSLLADFS